MSHLIIHVGTYGIEASDLQNSFAQDRTFLDENGIVYPAFGTDINHDILARFQGEAQNETDAEQHWQSLIGQYAQTGQTVLISSCMFLRLAQGQGVLESIGAMAAKFGRVSVICSVQNQAHFLQSAYQEISKTRQPGNWADIFSYATHHKKIDSFHMDYNAVYDQILTGFSPSEITFLPINSGAEGKEAFYREILEIEACPQTNTENTSGFGFPEPIPCFFANQLAIPEHPSNKVTEIIQNAYETFYKSPAPATFLAKVEHSKLSEIFDPLNRKFERRVSIFQRGFRIPAMLNGQDHSYRGVMAKNFWLEISRQFAAHPA